MKKGKRLGCLALVVVLVLSLVLPGLPQAVRAEETAEATVSVEHTYAVPGAAVEVRLLLENNPGIAGARLTISYDDGLELVNGVSQGALSELEYFAPGSFESPCVFNWDSEGQEATDDGVMLTLTFRVSEEAKLNDCLDVELGCRYGDVYNADLDTVDLQTVNGSVTVLNHIPGDVNGDQVVNGKDVTLLRRYNGSGFDVTINEAAADVNNDGMINGKDVTLIRRYIAGGYDAKLQFPTQWCAHALEKVAAQPASCTREGNIAYWSCLLCGGLYADETGAAGLTRQEVLLEKKEHTIVTDPPKAATTTSTGLTEGSHCGNCFLVLAPQQIIPVLDKGSHNVYYYDQNRTCIKAETFTEEDGLFELWQPELKGYQFVGWYTAPNGGGNFVDCIDPGTAKDIKLYAHCQVITYTIYYRDTLGKKTDTYTVNDRIILEEGIWRGRRFVGWTDPEGKVYTEIPKGTVGDLELTAQWKVPQNLAIPAEEDQDVKPFYYDAEKKQYYFVYKIGTLEHVVLDDLVLNNSLKSNEQAGDLSFSLTETVTIEESRSETIGKIISTSVSHSKEWSDAVENASGSSQETHFDVTAGVELGMESFPLKAKLEATFGSSTSTNTSYAHTATTGGSDETGSEESNETSVSLSYLEQISSSITKEMTISADMPRGYYAYVRAANVRVYGIVAFDCITGNYTLSTFSMLDNMHETTLYYPSLKDLEKQNIDVLPYNVPVTEIVEYIEKNYYVNYDGNGGNYSYALENTEQMVEGMPLSVHPMGEPGTLAENLYTRVGYAFEGWSTEKDGQVLYQDGGKISVMEPGKVVTLYAQWSPVTYTVTYEPNGGCLSGDYTTRYTVEDQVLILPVPVYNSYPQYNHFLGWFTDEACTIPYTGDYQTAPQNLILYAKWDLCQVYNSIDSTPVTLEGRVILDWSKEEDTDLSNHWDRMVEDYQYDVVNIGGLAREVILIGNPGQIFTNLQLRAAGFAEDQQLTIRFENFNYISNRNIALAVEDSKSLNLTVDARGVNSVGSSCNGGNILGGDGIDTVTFTGDGSLTLTAGNGQDGALGAAGTNGGTAVSANLVTVDMTGSLSAVGGNGGNGGDANGWSDYHGNSGKNAGHGGHGMDCLYMKVLKADQLTLIGGNGGNGGEANDGKRGKIDFMYYSNGGNGGNGGRGGDGGHSVTGDVQFVDAKELNFVGGCGGDGGDAGNGGMGGDQGGTIYFATPAGFNGGNGGVGGSAGHGGNGLTPGECGEVGTGGTAGKGTSGGYWVSPIQGKNGNPGKNGEPGKNGLQLILLEVQPSPTEMPLT